MKKWEGRTESKEKLKFEECEKCEDWKGCITYCLNICRKPLDALEEFNTYKALEEKGKLLKLPCAVGDTVWYISDKTEKQGRKKAVVSFVDEGIVDHITLGQVMIPQITVCNSNNEWITFDAVEDFGKTVFLTKEEAEAALKAMGK